MSLRTNHQKEVALAFFLALVWAGSLTSGEPGPQPNIVVSTTNLERGSAVILGELGLPLGTPAEVEGMLLPPKKTPYVTVPVEILLAVDTIDGRKLDSPREFRFRVENSNESRLQNTELELRSVFNFLVAEHELSGEEADKLFAEYTKVRRKLLVYESAHFIGRPRDLPSTMPRTSAPPFGFETFLVVVTPKHVPLPLAANELVFDRPRVEVTLPTDSNEAKVAFPFKNTSSSSVRIREIRTDCDCIQASGPTQEIDAGKTGEITLNFRSKLRNGTDRFRAVVSADNGEFQEISVTARLRSYVEVQPLTLRWRKGEKREPREFVVSSTGLGKLRFTKVVANDSKVEILSARDPETIRVVVTPPTGDPPFRDTVIVSAVLEGTGETRVYDLHVRGE